MVHFYMRISHALCTSFLIFTTLTEGQSGLIAQYLDFGCTETSLVDPTVSLPLDTCLVTSAQGLAAQRLPNCPTGTAKLQVYQDEACAIPDSSKYNNCIIYDSDVIVVMFICGSVADGNSGPTSTTTATAGSVLVPVAKATGATGATTTSTSTSGGDSSQTATDLNGLSTSAAPTSSTSNPLQTNASNDDGDSSSGLSHRDQIILGVALPVGSLVVALLAWLYPKYPKPSR
ncbi:MAG: hypothetical protein Q9161_005152 [Pseudevernia consocians]